MSLSGEPLFETQNQALRDPQEVVSSAFSSAGITGKSAEFIPDENFASLLADLNITLLITREYEHLAVALSATNNKFRQSFMCLPHPSGIAVNRETDTVYIAATRNPNQLIELRPIKGFEDRVENTETIHSQTRLVPTRTKYYPGSYYFHDLAVINGELYANSVGMNGIIKVDFNNPLPEQPMWWPVCLEENGKPNHSGNFIQLNSIAGGKTIEESFFTASGSTISSIRPGHPEYPVDKQGIVIDGKTREIIATGLTRPHSARIYNNRIWVANSGYGEFGYIENGKFEPFIKLSGWTRGVCIYKDIAFIGISRILPKFTQYAPGVDAAKAECGIVAVSLHTGEIIARLQWPYGNQLFAIEYMDSNKCSGFLYNQVTNSSQNERSTFYKYSL